MSMASIPAIPGIEQRSEPMAGAVRFLGPYFTDEIEMLVRAARGLRQRERHFIAPDGDGKFSIYRRPVSK